MAMIRNATVETVLPLVLACLVATTGCVNAGNSKGTNPAGTTPTQAANQPENSGTDVTLQVLGVANAHVDSVVLGKAYRSYGFHLGARNLAPQNTKYTTYCIPTNTSDVYEESGNNSAVNGTFALYHPETVDLSGTTVTQNGLAAERLLWNGYAVLALFEAPSGDYSRSGSNSLSFNFGNEYLWEKYISRPSSGNWTVSLLGSGTDDVEFSLYREVKATISVKDNNGTPMLNLTKDNFKFSADIFFNNSNGPITPAESNVTSEGKGVYTLTLLVQQQEPNAQITVTTSIINAPGSGSTSF